MKLFDPITINGMTLKNRVVMLPMVLGLDFRGKQSREFYVERAKGGVGAIMTSGTFVDMFLSDDAWREAGALESFLENLRLMTKEVHQAGAKIGMQLIHLNRYFDRTGPPNAAEKPKAQWVAPSAWVEPTPSIHTAPEGKELRALTTQEVEQIVANFGKAAGDVKSVGFDFVEIHSSHGTLPCQFFSKHDNHRTDKYGGSAENRMRFGIECVTKMRQAVGKGFPIFFRIPSVDELDHDANTLADSIPYAKALEKAGVDCFDVTVGISAHKSHIVHISPNKKQPMGTYAPYAAAIKQAVKAPVIAVGRINKPEVAEEILAKGQADLIGIGRQLITDPMWVKKVAEGRAQEIVACDSCNINCWGVSGFSRMEPGSSACKLNPRAGKEWESA